MDLLLTFPVDIHNNDETISVQTWESFEERTFKTLGDSLEFLTRKIGSYNVLQIINIIEDFCQNDIDKFEITDEGTSDVLTKLFEMIMDDLEKAKIIRKIPEFRRKDIRLIVDNT